MLTPAEDAALRADAMQWLAQRTNDGLDPISFEELGDYRFRGEKFPLKDRQLGIRKPRIMSAALSITTTYRTPGAERPYDDKQGIDGLMRYKWHGTDPGKYTNRALREAWHQRVPLIWFWGVAPGLFKPFFPVYVVDEECDQHQFVVAIDGQQTMETVESTADEVARRWVVEDTKRRLHQPLFRSLVMRAYEKRCAICTLGHEVLLDAAHIVPDADEDGVAAVRNGLALCKIHHAAYDARIIGITPDYQVAVREDILDEVDGPMLEFGLKGLEGQRLSVIPAVKRERPDRELLDRQFTRFREAPATPSLRVDIARRRIF